MVIRFSEEYKVTSERYLATRRSHVESVVRNPDQRELVSLPGKGGGFQLYRKRVEDIAIPVEWLVIAAEEDGDQTVRAAYPIPLSELPDQAASTPLDLLRFLCDRYGFDVRVGQKTGRLIVSEKVSMKPDEPPSAQVDLIEVPEGPYHAGMFIKKSEPGDQELRVVMAFGISLALLQADLESA